jgi:hypothetical protein
VTVVHEISEEPTMETQTTQMKTWETFLVYLFLCVLTITSIVTLIFYFSKLYTVGHSRGERMAVGFGIGFVVALALAAIGTWRAIREPTKQEDEDDEEEVEDEEE